MLICAILTPLTFITPKSVNGDPGVAVPILRTVQLRNAAVALITLAFIAGAAYLHRGT